jgi:ligand-binding SRPBCC domain-containing protein
MQYKHNFKVNAPQPVVAAFHMRSGSMGAITPPPIRTQVHSAPADLSTGGEMDFTLWFGPFPIHWKALIENVSRSGFVDRQISGPFTAWVHRHSFEPLPEGGTEVVDNIRLHFKLHLWWGLVGLGFWLGLPFLFAYRGWKTRRLLESSPVQ